MPNTDAMFYSCQKSILRKNYPVLPVEKLAQPRNTIMLQHPIVQFPVYHLLSGRLREVAATPRRGVVTFGNFRVL